MSTGIKLLIGGVLFLALGWLGIHFAVPNNLPGAKNAVEMNQLLQRNAESALSNAGIDYLSIKVDGQKAVISGEVFSPNDLEEIKEIVLSSSGSGGVFVGGVTRVDIHKVTIAKPVVDPKWNATLAKDGGLVISGYVNNISDRKAILNQANPLFVGEIVDEMKTAPDVFVGATPQMIATLGWLKQLDNGSVTLQDSHFLLRGKVGDKLLADELSTGMQSINQGFTGSAEISWPPPIENEFGVAVDIGPIKQAAKCQELFNESLAKNKILFQIGSAQIDQDSHKFLDFLARLAGQCDQFALKIGGHTDNTGTIEYNLYLSNQRANAVMKYLVPKGVKQERISAIGFGPNQPTCQQRTRACRAQNRRIEITVEK